MENEEAVAPAETVEIRISEDDVSFSTSMDLPTTYFWLHHIAFLITSGQAQNKVSTE